MANYTKATDFASKDALLTGDPLKIVKGTEIDDEFNAIATAVNSKSNTESPTFTGTPAAPTAAAGTNTTQLATTAHVFAERTNTATLTNKTLTSPTINTATIDTPTITNGTISGANITGITDLAVADGGTGASTANGALTNLLPSQTSNSGKYLTTDGTNTSWASAGIGEGQTWASYSGSRSVGTWYQNATGRSIMVSVGINVGSYNGYFYFDIANDGSGTGAVTVDGSLISSGDNRTDSFGVIVPAGKYYKVYTNASPISYTVYFWAELR